jgi:hypothetical protein
MKRSIMKLTGLGIGLSLIALTPACGGLRGRAETPSSATGAVSVNVKLDLPNVGNPKYDAFFNDVIALEQLVADARDALDNAPATLNKAMSFRRVKGHQDMPLCVAALRPAAKIVAVAKKVA